MSFLLGLVLLVCLAGPIDARLPWPPARRQPTTPTTTSP